MSLAGSTMRGMLHNRATAEITEAHTNQKEGKKHRAVFVKRDRLEKRSMIEETFVNSSVKAVVARVVVFLVFGAAVFSSFRFLFLTKS